MRHIFHPRKQTTHRNIGSLKEETHPALPPEKYSPLTNRSCCPFFQPHRHIFVLSNTLGSRSRNGLPPSNYLSSTLRSHLYFDIGPQLSPCHASWSYYRFHFGPDFRDFNNTQFPLKFGMVPTTNVGVFSLRFHFVPFLVLLPFLPHSQLGRRTG